MGHTYTKKIHGLSEIQFKWALTKADNPSLSSFSSNYVLSGMQEWVGGGGERRESLGA